MDKFTIPCTEEQTKRALDLGAPIKIECFSTATEVYWRDVIPTAEQMIGWLEEQGIWIHFCKPNQRPKLLSYSISNINNIYQRVFIGKEFYSRKKATLAAIDDALKYLINNKK